ncbi:unnamed protein product [Clonostachys rhizophaga]|uniref:Xylanolytic transcriptional activator regulatory domain-containing protein n=1 Tax=Clonostachys rhizophaga TaxID=160324 RepID=A0A9N9YHK0_9HYPO|nr:unnamed protein product [Clonostachys rhizophaga]
MAKQRRACDGCHKRKIQCDLSESGPKCLPCTFTRLKKTESQKPKKKGSRDNISKRIERIEEFIAQNGSVSEGQSTASPSDASDAGNPPQPPAVGIEEHQSFSTPSNDSSSRLNRGPMPGRSACGQIYFAGCYLGTIDSPDRIPAFSAEGLEWIFSATGEHPSFTKNAIEGSGSFKQSFHAPMYSSDDHPNGRERFPDLWITQAFVRDFMESSIRHVFPIIDEVLFERTIEIAYGPEPGPNSSEYLSSRASVLAFVSLMSFHFSTIPAAAHIDRLECMTWAQSLIGRCVNFPSLTTLQTLVSLQLNSMVLGHMQAGVMFHGMACRTTCTLGAHTIVPSPPSSRALTVPERIEEQQRKMFWVCYIFDKNLALRTGQPPSLCDEFCDLTLPPEYVKGRFGVPEYEHLARVPYPVLFGDIRLSLIKSKVSRELYSIQSLRKSNAELLQSIRELDEELESWRSSLPRNFKPRVSLSPHYEKWMSDMEFARSVQHIELHLEYHHLVASIHGASGRCFKNGRVDPKIIGLQSSLDLAVEASRTTIIYLSVAIDSLPREAFWAFLFHPMSALITLFFNILRDPLAAEAESDTSLICTAGDLIQRLPSHQLLRLHETSFIENLGAFVAELSRLAAIAIAKARNERVG